MKLSETITYPGLEGVSFCECPYVVCMYPVDLVRTGSEVNTGCVFPRGVLAATTLVGGGAGVGGARARARCKPGFSAQWLLQPYWMGAQEAGAEPLTELGFSWCDGSLPLG